ncbi:MAG: exported protein of unknown function [Promethearchaeota archaeon]|nr:MAG: exported protein of unknown function [Candidatus Lokiarchaeota archaeon]
MYFKTNQILRGKFGLILLFFCLIAMCFCSGCNSTSAQPSAETETETDTEQAIKETMENQQEIMSQLREVKGDLINVQKTITTSIKKITNSVKNIIKTESTAIQKSQQMQFEKFEGEYTSNQDIKESSNSMWYGIGLLIVMLVFLLVRDLIDSIFEKGNTGKIFARKIFKDW